MLCHRLSGHPGILHRLFFLCSWFVLLLPWVLWGGPQLHFQLFHLLALLWYVLLFFILSLRILSYTLPTLLASVIPRSLLHFPFIPFPLYSLLISPSSQLSGIFSLLCIAFIILQNIFLVSVSASMKISLGILSGPRLFFLLSFVIAPFSSWITIGSYSVPGFVYCCWVFFIVAVIILVDSSYSWVPGLAWYRCYVAMCSLVSSGFIISLPSSVMVLYFSSLFPLACLLACLRALAHPQFQIRYQFIRCCFGKMDFVGQQETIIEWSILKMESRVVVDVIHLQVTTKYLQTCI